MYNASFHYYVHIQEIQGRAWLNFAIVVVCLFIGAFSMASVRHSVFDIDKCILSCFENFH